MGRQKDNYIRWFEELTGGDVAIVGGKNASLGEMIRALKEEGMPVPDGFATSADACWTFLEANDLEPKIRHCLDAWQKDEILLQQAGKTIRRLVRQATFPEAIAKAIQEAYRELSRRYEMDEVDVAVRSSATAEDLPQASFAGQQETFLNVTGEAELLEACRNCYASLFTERAISYRQEQGFDHMQVALSVGVQKMVRADKAGAGVMFTIDTETGFPDAIVSRELGIPAIVGSDNATRVLRDGQAITLSCAQGERGYVYEGYLEFEEEELDLEDVPETQTPIMMNIASPDAAFRWWRLPLRGVGLARMEFIINNEYADLIGGRQFEPEEENPMLGWRGASRYYSEGYRDGFAVECRAIKHVREEMGLDNAIVMIPFCRTPEEADRVLKVLAENGLKRGEHRLQVYVMCEVPANVFLAEQFAQRFDGFSIGSNDLTQLVLGVDRDSAALTAPFDERNEAVKRMIGDLIETAHAAGTPVSICGEAPRNYPEFAVFLVKAGIDSISLNPDSVIEVIRRVATAEVRDR